MNVRRLIVFSAALAPILASCLQDEEGWAPTSTEVADLDGIVAPHGTPTPSPTPLVGPFSPSRAGFDGPVHAIEPAIDGSGDFYVAGNFRTYNGESAPGIVRLDADGDIDAAFAVGSGFPGGDQVPYALAAATDGSGGIFLTGSFDNYNRAFVSRVLKLKRDGRIDWSFHPTLEDVDGFGYALMVAPDGSGDLYVGGHYIPTWDFGNDTWGIVRLNRDGTRDPAFSRPAGFQSVTYSIASAPGGRGEIYIGGTILLEDGTHHVAARLRPDGSVDPAFRAQGIGGQAAGALLVAPDGTWDLYVGGTFTSIGGVAVNRLARLNSNGSVDAGFQVASGVDDTVWTIKALPSERGDIVVGGSFSSYAGASQRGLVRLNPDGTRDLRLSVGGFNNAVTCIVAATNGSGSLYLGGGFTTYGTSAVGRIAALKAGGGLQ